jgi:hypothetical protein
MRLAAELSQTNRAMAMAGFTERTRSAATVARMSGALPCSGRGWRKARREIRDTPHVAIGARLRRDPPADAGYTARADYDAQFSICNLGTRTNSRVLFVTRIMSRARACPAISTS